MVSTRQRTRRPKPGADLQDREHRRRKNSMIGGDGAQVVGMPWTWVERGPCGVVVVSSGLGLLLLLLLWLDMLLYTN